MLIVFYQQKLNKNEIFQQITVNANEIHQLDAHKVFFKLLYEKSNNWIFFGRALCSRFSIIKKSGKLKGFKRICVSTKKNHEDNSLGVLNHSPKGVMTDTFRGEYFP